MEADEPVSALTLRPYELLCMVCGLAGEAPGSRRPAAERALAAVRSAPDLPVALVCNAGDVYVYQDPGPERDTPGSPEYNRKRDLDILQKLDLAPGSTLPARTLLYRAFRTIPTVLGVCGYGEVTGDAWRGCPRATSGAYEKAREAGVDAIIAPRSEEEMSREKERSLKAMYEAEAVTTRPHILMCAVCQYGSGVRPPFPPDNLPELVQLLLRKPSTPVRLAPGADWMMCAPCPKHVPELNACVNVAGSGGLSNEKRDLDLLQKLGLQYGATMPGSDLFLLLLERVPSTQAVCARDNPSPSVWWDACGEANCTQGNKTYEAGREALLAEFRRL